ncbi:MAG: aldehyde dehydrogenase family protein [Burkholderiaceae bacterium]
MAAIRACARWAAACDEARAAGARVLLPAGIDETLSAKGPYVPPTIVTELSSDHPLARRELFLPWVTVHAVDDFDQALAHASAGQYGLTAGLYSRKPDEIERFEESMEAGVLYVNRPSGATTGAWPGHQTFGGWKMSGTTGKNSFGSHYLQLFGREKSMTLHKEPNQ